MRMTQLACFACTASTEHGLHLGRFSCREHPPRVKTGADFAQWMCEAHNNANMLLGKPTFECSRRARLGHNFVAPAADAFV